MSDYDPPRPPGWTHETLKAPQVDPVTRSSGTGGYVLGGVLVVLALMAGLMFVYPGNAPGERNDQARMPDRTIETPAPTNPQR